jgi:PIN domain nuclease of toxin-antitoxin system
MALRPGLLMDTHVLFWLRQGTIAEKPEVMEAIHLAAEENNWFVSSMSLYELANASARKRLDFEEPAISWFRDALTYPGPQLLDITPEIAVATMSLPDSFHGDSGDRIIAATAITYGLTVCTHDKVLLRFAKQGLFQAIKVTENKE